jgi:hypothetical protein
MSSGLLDQRREELFAAAEKFVMGGKTQELQRLICDAASAYGKEREAHFRPKQSQESTKLVIPFGRTRGTPIAEATTKDLNFVLERLKEGLDDPARAKFRADNETLIAAIERELETR